MAEKKPSEAEFRAELAKRAQAALMGQSSRHMTPAPTGGSISLEEMLGDSETTAASTTDSNVKIDAPAEVKSKFQADGQVVLPIGIHLIEDSPWQPRLNYDESGLAELADSLKQNGQDEAIHVVALPGGRYRLVSGHRRTRAARMVGWAQINAIILDLDPRSVIIATLRANESREDLSTFERGRAYQRAMDEGLASNQKEVAALFSCTQGRVSQCLTVFNISPGFSDLQNKHPRLLHYRSAKAIHDLLKKFPAGEEQLLEAAERLIDEPDMDVREFVELAMRKLQGKPVVTRNKDPLIFRDPGGKETFSLKSAGTKLVVDIKGGFDPEVVNRHLVELLERLGQELQAPEDNATAQSTAVK